MRRALMSELKLRPPNSRKAQGCDVQQEIELGEGGEEQSLPARNVQAPAHVDLALAFDGVGPDIPVSEIGGDIELVDNRHAARQVARSFDFDIVLAGGGAKGGVERCPCTPDRAAIFLFARSA